MCSCRVDYIHGQTTFHTHNLAVLVEAGRPRIMMGSVEVSQEEEEVGWLEVRENSSLRLLCVSEGGRPPPSLSWWLDDTRLDQSYVRSSSSHGQTELELVLPSVGRSLTSKLLTCESSNTALAPPSHASLQLELLLAPDRLEVERGEEGRGRVLVLGEATTLTCTARGARPLPTITWAGKHILSQEELRYQVGREGGRGGRESLLVSFIPLQFVTVTYRKHFALF